MHRTRCGSRLVGRGKYRDAQPPGASQRPTPHTDISRQQKTPQIRGSLVVSWYRRSSPPHVTLLPGLAFAGCVRTEWAEAHATEDRRSWTWRVQDDREDVTKSGAAARLRTRTRNSRGSSMRVDEFTVERKEIPCDDDRMTMPRTWSDRKDSDSPWGRLPSVDAGFRYPPSMLCISPRYRNSSGKKGRDEAPVDSCHARCWLVYGLR